VALISMRFMCTPVRRARLAQARPCSRSMHEKGGESRERSALDCVLARHGAGAQACSVGAREAVSLGRAAAMRFGRRLVGGVSGPAAPVAASCCGYRRVSGCSGSGVGCMGRGRRRSLEAPGRPGMSSRCVWRRECFRLPQRRPPRMGAWRAARSSQSSLPPEASCRRAASGPGLRGAAGVASARPRAPVVSMRARGPPRHPSVPAKLR